MAENQEMRIAAEIIDVDLAEEAQECAYTYGMAVNIARALPDVRDGCKPVHRRILTIMHERGLKPGGDFVKSAKVVGDVIGALHPHGNQAVYDALVRLVQPHAMRYPLVDGQGSFGDVDGNPPAAMRYTEVRWSEIGVEMVRDIDQDTVDQIPSYDQSRLEPKVLPARFPNLLCNGTAGIGWAMQTNIAPHNLSEIVDLAAALIDQPDLPDEALLQLVPGPDFPTGGLIIGRDGIRDAYLKGKGSIVMRGETVIEEDRRNVRIVITSIPYGVSKSRLISCITELVLENQRARKGREGRSLYPELDDVEDVRDETDRSGMRIVIECRKGAAVPVILQRLYRMTPLQETFAYNAVALVDGKPRENLTLRELVWHYLQHQKDVTVRKARYERAQLARRLHIQRGLLAAVSQLDATIQLIRSHTGTKAELLPKLQALLAIDGQPIDLEQAERIADMPLYRISALESEKLRAEVDELQRQISRLDAFIADERQVWQAVKQDLLDLKARHGDARRTRIVDEEREPDPQDLIKPQEMVVTLTLGGAIKRTPLSAFRTQRRRGSGVGVHDLRGDDVIADLLVGNTRDEVYFFTHSGKVLRRLVHDIPEAARDGRGRAVVPFLGLDPEDGVLRMLSLPRAQADHSLVMITRSARIVRTPLSEFTGSSRIGSTGVRALTTDPGDQLVEVAVAPPDATILVATRSGKCIHFPLKGVPGYSRGAKGVRAMTLEEGDAVLGAIVAGPGTQVLAVSTLGWGKRTPIEEYVLQRHGGSGRRLTGFDERSGALAAVLAVRPEDEVVMVTEQGVAIRFRADEIPELGRRTRGSRLMNVRDGDRIAAVARVRSEADLPVSGEEAASLSTGSKGAAQRSA